jgi:hypothetical protein
MIEKEFYMECGDLSPLLLRRELISGVKATMNCRTPNSTKTALL